MRSRLLYVEYNLVCNEYSCPLFIYYKNRTRSTRQKSTKAYKMKKIKEKEKRYTKYTISTVTQFKIV